MSRNKLVHPLKTISAIMDEIKNMLDYKVGHYIKYERHISVKQDKHTTIIHVH